MPSYFQGVDFAGDPRTGIIENYVQGVRTPSLDWHPQTKQLWFTKSWTATGWAMSLRTTRCTWPRARASISAIPIAPGDTLDPEFGKNRDCKEFHAADTEARSPYSHPSGCASTPARCSRPNTRTTSHRHARLVNRTVKHGYNVTSVSFDADGQGQDGAVPHRVPPGRESDPPMWGRPNDVMVMRDGSMLVSDDKTGSSTA